MAITKYTKKDGSTAYRARVYIGKDPETQGDVYRKKSGFKTKKSAQQWVATQTVDASMYGISHFVSGQSRAITMQEVVELWLMEYEKTVKPITYLQTLTALRTYILPYFGEKALKDITPAELKKAVLEWKEHTVAYRNFLSRIKRLYRFAIANELYRGDNPCDRVVLPRFKGEEKKKLESDKYLNLQEAHKLLSTCKTYDNPIAYPLFRLLLYTGLRIGEVLALTWDDIHFDDSYLEVRTTISYSKHGKYIISDTPKTESSKRVVFLDAETLVALQAWKRTQLEKALKYRIDRATFVFPDIYHTTFYHPDQARRLLEKLCSEAHIKRVTPHALRHTHASLLLEAGVGLKEIQTRLGHRTINMTADIYAHLSNEKKQETANRFAEYL